MTLTTLFLMIVIIYLVLIAYGVVGLRRRRVAGRARLIAAAMIVVAPPALIAGLLAATGESELVRTWRLFLLAMPIVGALAALLADQIARRVLP